MSTQWPESVPWHDADTIGDVHLLCGEVDRVFQNLRCRRKAQFALYSAFDAIPLGELVSVQKRADTWNAAMASLGYTEIYEVRS